MPLIAANTCALVLVDYQQRLMPALHRGTEALAAAQPYLLEPIEKLELVAPSSSTSRITQAISARRGQILGFRPREGWAGWDQIDACLPRHERLELIAELRGLTQGMGAFLHSFDHMAELSGRLAEEVVKEARAA